MEIKKFEAETIEDALRVIKKKVGPNAVIIATRRIKSAYGLMGRSSIEVTVAVEGNKEELEKYKKKINLVEDKKVKTVRSSKEISKEGFFLGKQEAFSMLKSYLNQIGVFEDLNQYFCRKLKDYFIQTKNPTQEEILEYFKMMLIEKVRLVEPLKKRLSVPGAPRVLAFVGPTGVGKTTTLAKIAAGLSAQKDKKIILVSADTYKIAAVDQLQTYAELLDVHLELCSNRGELVSLLSSLNEDYIVLVDTAGYGPRDGRKMNELRVLLSDVHMETHLCVSACTKEKDAHDIISRFFQLELSHLIVTKLDETTTQGSILNLCELTHLPLSFFTIGQRVPDDIVEVDVQKIINFVVKPCFESTP